MYIEINMPPVKKIADCNDLVPTNRFPGDVAHFPFDTFNPVQSRIFEVYDKDANCVIAAATSAGKTVCAEMFMSHEVRKRGGKAMYLAPLRALAKEKIDDWTDESHHFGNVNLSICTGDYRLTADRKKELESANVIIMTSEMLNARSRNYKSEHNEFLKDVGTLIVDEAHLLTVPRRGDHLEVGLMKFSEIAPNARIVLLSATMPNVDEISEWTSYYLTGRDTYLLESIYRPCPLGVHYETYIERSNYEDNELAKVDEALRLVRLHKDDKFLIFVHTKRTGHLMKSFLKKIGIDAEFHNADLEKDARHALEKKFKVDSSMRVIIATSTLAWGLNLPARRVVITGVHRGLDLVENYDIWQEAGRAGRPGYDPRGDVYILVPEHEQELHIKRIQTPQRIESKLLENAGREGGPPQYKTFAFHLVSEIHHRSVKNKADVKEWYGKSLARFQTDELDDDVIDSTIEMLKKRGCVREEDDEYVTTMVGTISSMFYYPPFDVADLRRNFKVIFEHGYDKNDMIVSMMLGDVDSQRFGIVNKIEREEMSVYASKIRMMFGDRCPTDGAIKAGYAYYCLMNGYNLGAFVGFASQLQYDFPRCSAVLSAVDTMNTKWSRTDWFRKLQSRVRYGVGIDLVDLVQIPNIGKVRAEKLWSAGLKTLDTVADNPGKVQRILNMKEESVLKICNNARDLSHSS